MIPGSNLLNRAFRLIAKQTVTYYHATGRGINNVGQNVTVYAAPVSLVGSFQPVPRRLYQVYGLDFQKSYFTFYTSNNILDVTRDVSGDQLSFNSRRYQCESNNEWFPIDGWVGVLCVDIGANSEFSNIFGFSEPPTQNFDNGSFADA